MDAAGLAVGQVAGMLGVAEQTVRNWRSVGVPPRRMRHVRHVMATWRPGDPDGYRGESSLTLRCDPERHSRWCRAASIAGQGVVVWAFGALDSAAAREFLHELPLAADAGPARKPPAAGLDGTFSV